MGLLTDHTIFDLILVATTLLMLIIAYFSYAYKYWERRKVPFLPPKFPMGNSAVLFSKTITLGLETAAFYKQAKKMGYKYAGVYIVTRPVLIVVDPDFIRDILSKDFQYFIDRGVYHNEKDDPISAHLFSLDETKWKNMRVKLTPTFTSGKMKMMFQTVLDVSEYLIDAIELSAQMKKDIDIRDFLARFTTDVIGSCAFGIDCNSFKDPDAEFRKMGNNFFIVNGIRRMVELILISKLPKLSLKLGLRAVRKDMSEFFHEVVNKTVKYREENNYSRPDFLQMLIEMKNSTKDTANPFTMEQLVSQVFLFFVAGFDTSSTTMNFAIYELCRNPDVQEKARAEVNAVLGNHGGKITYESLSEMKYLQQVIDEAQRLYPPLVNLTRTCVKDYKINDTEAIIEKGIQVVIPLAALHRDPEYYPDPDKFDPERFSTANKSSRHPYVHLPFGEGPRNCIGLRFGLMQTKIGLATILRKFRLRISPTTRMPLHLDQHVFLLKSVETLYVTAEKIQ